MVNGKSDADRIRAAKALLDTHRRDPLADESDVYRLLRTIIDLAIAHIPEANQGAFIAQARAIA